MRILTRYLIRAHVGPFVFALVALTGLLWLNAVAQKLQDLTGKGLGWRPIGEFMVLTLPHTIALTLPMAVLVAVLYAFSELTSHNELTAMKAGGINPRRLLIPMLGIGIILAEVMFVFNDQVLPEANHRLKDLQVDIGRKSPTFELRESVVNQIEASDGNRPVYLTASRIDQASNQLENVVIYDSQEGGTHRTIYGAHGTMAFNAQRTDLFLTLHDGVVLETDPDHKGGFRQVYFNKQILPLRGVGNELERRAEADRGDREMGVDMLQDHVDDRRAELNAVMNESRTKSRNILMQALGENTHDSAAAAASVAPPVPPTAGVPTPPVPSATTGKVVAGRPAISIPSGPVLDALTESALTESRAVAAHQEAAERGIDQFQVEIQKKYALSFACIVFVLVGAPIAMRYPRGGLGLVIAASSAIFAVSWAGLIGGENLADRNITSPVVGMWGPNLIFTVFGILLVLRMGRESGNVRGGAWDEIVFNLKSWWGRVRGKSETA